ncbi:MAG TPA: SCO family protein [Chthoniobacteraceae bacterium]|jgi:protein SCO1/2|nr:SCO family protein [Chthoniobacteraceae bacterium]
MNQRTLIVILGLAVALAAGLTWQRRHNAPAFEMLYAQPGATATELPRLWQIPDFSLTERSGQPVTLSQLQGRVWIADFFYTTCPGPCPMLTSRFSQLQKELSAQPDLRFVSISSDPEKDTPAVLQTYAEHFQAGDRWLFLTGDKKAIYDLANQGFKLSLVEDKTKAVEPVIHSTKLILIDRSGTVRGVYDGLTEQGKGKLLRDLHTVLGEKP